MYNTGVVTSILKLIVRVVLRISLGSHLWKRYHVNKLLAFSENADAEKNLLIYRFDFCFGFCFLFFKYHLAVKKKNVHFNQV